MTCKIGTEKGGASAVGKRCQLPCGSAACHKHARQSQQRQSRANVKKPSCKHAMRMPPTQENSPPPANHHTQPQTQAIGSQALAQHHYPNSIKKTPPLAISRCVYSGNTLSLRHKGSVSVAFRHCDYAFNAILERHKGKSKLATTPLHSSVKLPHHHLAIVLIIYFL